MTLLWCLPAAVEAQSYLSLILADKDVRRTLLKKRSFEVNPRKLSASDIKLFVRPTRAQLRAAYSC